jgi:hypothetical membrane protein
VRTNFAHHTLAAQEEYRMNGRVRSLLLSGMLASLVYVCAVLLGGALWKEYSHAAQPVSDLIAADAPQAWLLNPLFALYNALTLCFGVALFLFVKEDSRSEKRSLGRAGALVLLAEGVFGLLILFFPEDAGGMKAAISSSGRMHILLAGLSSMSTMLAVLLMGFYFGGHARLRALGLYSFLSVTLIFMSGGLAAFSVANHNLMGGVFERVTIGAFLQWLFGISYRLRSVTRGDGAGNTRSF